MLILSTARSKTSLSMYAEQDSIKTDAAGSNACHGLAGADEGSTAAARPMAGKIKLI